MKKIFLLGLVILTITACKSKGKEIKEQIEVLEPKAPIEEVIPKPKEGPLVFIKKTNTQKNIALNVAGAKIPIHPEIEEIKESFNQTTGKNQLNDAYFVFDNTGNVLEVGIKTSNDLEIYKYKKNDFSINIQKGFNLDLLEAEIITKEQKDNVYKSEFSIFTKDVNGITRFEEIKTQKYTTEWEQPEIVEEREVRKYIPELLSAVSSGSYFDFDEKGRVTRIEINEKLEGLFFKNHPVVFDFKNIQPKNHIKIDYEKNIAELYEIRDYNLLETVPLNFKYNENGDFEGLIKYDPKTIATLKQTRTKNQEVFELFNAKGELFNKEKVYLEFDSDGNAKKFIHSTIDNTDAQKSDFLIEFNYFREHGQLNSLDIKFILPGIIEVEGLFELKE